MAEHGRARLLAGGPARARRRALAGAAALALLALPPVRRAMEAGMATHMLLQFPALIAAGALLASACPASLGRSVARWNALGIAGLSASAGVLALAMIPRLLDLALVDVRVEAAKWAALLLCGAALRMSWRPAGVVVQGFFLGNVLPMTGVVGVLYQDATTRLCNSYRLDEQALVGQALVWLAIAVAAAWLAQAAARSMRAEREGLRGRAGA
ncbi:MAG: hypothetical protein M9907_06350 [Burkholderiaceae bacterium]|nr:hypothetical protein [Burkholderiaceae bacterium]